MTKYNDVKYIECTKPITDNRYICTLAGDGYDTILSLFNFEIDKVQRNAIRREEDTIRVEMTPIGKDARFKCNFISKRRILKCSGDFGK